jgi:hypothetical protein
MHTFSLIFELDIARALYDHLRIGSPEVELAIGSAAFTAWLAEVNWAAVLAFTCLVVTTVGGTALQLWKQWKLIRLELADAERRLAKVSANRRHAIKRS